MKNESENNLFVEVRGPEEVRRDILESLKEIVENLQRFEKFKEIRKKKIAHINKLEKIVKEINKIVPNLKTSLPETKIRIVNVSKPQKNKKSNSVKTKDAREEPQTKPLTELQKLESELNEIESKLGSLR
ncbi:MAG: hypothetical protein V1831_02770 [Candidatus Woesearchaeota archaeon]